MKKQRVLMFVFFILFSILLTANAGDGMYYRIITSIDSGQNRDGIKVKITHDEDFFPVDKGHQYEVFLQQKAFPYLSISSDGSISIPITLLLHFEKMSMSDDRWNPYNAMDISVDNMFLYNEVNENILYLPIDLMTFSSEKHDIHLLNSYDVHMQYNIHYDANNYKVVNDLRIIFPVMEGADLNRNESKDGYYTINVKKGTSIPSDDDWQFYIGDQKIRITMKSGWMSYGKNGVYLPPDDEVIRQNPLLQDRCIILLTYHESKTKILHYAIVEGFWLDNNP